VSTPGPRWIAANAGQSTIVPTVAAKFVSAQFSADGKAVVTASGARPRGGGDARCNGPSTRSQRSGGEPSSGSGPLKTGCGSASRKGTCLAVAKQPWRVQSLPKNVFIPISPLNPICSK
jgi:hypothetical protein